MADYRQIHTKIWKDGWFLELEPNEKLLFIYLFSNERACVAGIYDLPLKVICFESCLDETTVLAALDKFAKAEKVFYEDGVVWVVNLIQYNTNNLSSPKIQANIRKTFSLLPECPLKYRWLEFFNGIVDDEYRIDTVSIPIHIEQEQEQEQEQEHGADAPKQRAKKQKTNSLPEQARVYLDSGGRFRSGKLKSGKTKKQAAIEFMVEKIPKTPEALAFWGQVVDGYCRQWSSYSYQTMVNEYFLRRRLPGGQTERPPPEPPQPTVVAGLDEKPEWMR